MATFKHVRPNQNVFLLLSVCKNLPITSTTIVSVLEWASLVRRLIFVCIVVSEGKFLFWWYFYIFLALLSFHC